MEETQNGNRRPTSSNTSKEHTSSSVISFDEMDFLFCNHPKRAGLTRPKKMKSQGIILAISCSNKATSL